MAKVRNSYNDCRRLFLSREWRDNGIQSCGAISLFRCLGLHDGPECRHGWWPFRMVENYPERVVLGGIASEFVSLQLRITRMTSAALLSFDEFEDALDSAKSRFDKRIGELKALVSGKPVYLFGYGGKGRTLASQIAKASNTEVIVFDSDSRTREVAAREGFSTIATRDELGQRGLGVILAACQAQMEQAALVPRNHIFYQEAGLAVRRTAPREQGPGVFHLDNGEQAAVVRDILLGGSTIEGCLDRCTALPALAGS